MFLMLSTNKESICLSVCLSVCLSEHWHKVVTTHRLAIIFISTLGGGGLEFYMKNRFEKNSPVLNHFLQTFVANCRLVSAVTKVWKFKFLTSNKFAIVPRYPTAYLRKLSLSCTCCVWLYRLSGTRVLGEHSASPRNKEINNCTQLATLGARGFKREEPQSSNKQRGENKKRDRDRDRGEKRGEKTSGCPWELIDLTAPIDLN